MEFILWSIYLNVKQISRVMKNKIYITVLSILFCFSLNAQQTSENFYYYQGEKISLQQRTDKMYLKFAPNVDKEQIRSIISSDTSLEATIGNVDDRFPNFIVLEAKNGQQISSTTIESFKKRTEIISATPLFQYGSVSQGLTDEFVVKLKNTTSYEQLQELAKQNDCKIEKENQFITNQFMISVSKTSRLNALQMSNLFYETGLFEFSEPNFVILNAFNSNDPLFSQQYYLKNTGQNSGTTGIDIKAEQAWTISTGANVRVAVVDQGVDLTHPDLQAHLLQGFDASGTNLDGAPVWSTDNHGTACAGIIGAIQDNGEGISGVAPNCRIIPIHMSNVQGNWQVDYAATAIDWAWRNGADVISNSWGGSSPYTPLTNAIDSAVTRGRGGTGCVVVFASGNESSSVSYPASLPNVIAVGAVNNKGVVWNYSNRGNELDVVAPSGGVPGGDVVTTDRMGANGYVSGNYVTTFGGTSAACPQVSGIAALILSIRPDLYAPQVRNVIETNCSLLGYSPTETRPNGKPWNNEVGYGLVNAYAAVESVELRISGPSSACTTGSAFSINSPLVDTVQWSISGTDLTLSNQSNTVSNRYQNRIG